MAVQRKGRVEGKAALITGAAGGLGAAMAWMLAREVFDFSWTLPWWWLPLGTALGAGVAAGVGSWTLRAVMRQSVTQTLRQSEP